MASVIVCGASLYLKIVYTVMDDISSICNSDRNLIKLSKISIL